MQLQGWTQCFYFVISSHLFMLPVFKFWCMQSLSYCIFFVCFFGTGLPHLRKEIIWIKGNTLQAKPLHDYFLKSSITHWLRIFVCKYDYVGWSVSTRAFLKSLATNKDIYKGNSLYETFIVVTFGSLLFTILHPLRWSSALSNQKTSWDYVSQSC